MCLHADSPGRKKPRWGEGPEKERAAGEVGKKEETREDMKQIKRATMRMSEKRHI